MPLIYQHLQRAEGCLRERGIVSARLDAEIVLAHALKRSKEFLYAHPEYRLSLKERAAFTALVERRCKREPIAYITNKKEFYGLDFYVDARVLIPRPETEGLVETALKSIAESDKGSLVIDVGTGSGCIIISIAAHSVRSHQFLATDISPDALSVAQENAQRHSVFNRIAFVRGNLIEPIVSGGLSFRIKKIFVIANLPYITQPVFETLEPEITRYEPASALLAPREDSSYYYHLLEKQISALYKRYPVPIHRLYETPEGIQKIPGP